MGKRPKRRIFKRCLDPEDAVVAHLTGGSCASEAHTFDEVLPGRPSPPALVDRFETDATNYALPGMPASPYMRHIIAGESTSVPTSPTSPGMDFASTTSRCSSKESYPPALDTLVERDMFFQVLGFWAHDEVVLRPASQSWESICQAPEVDATARSSSKRSDSIDIGTHSWVVHPCSKKRLVWDLLCVFFVSADVIFVPLYFFENMPSNSVTIIAAWCSRIFWLFDIIASLFTGIYVKGMLEMRPRAISSHYLRTWLLPDVLILAAQWVSILLETTLTAAMWPVMAFLRGSRVLRLFRLLQLLKVQMVLYEIGTRCSNVNFIVVGLVKFVTFLAISVHFLACIWYAIGWSRTDGWVHTQNLENESIFRSYTMSLHWTLAQLHGDSSFHPNNLQEYAFANVLMVGGLIVFCNLVGCVTHMLIQMDVDRSNEMHQQRLLCGYLKRHRISAALSVRARVHFESKIRQNQEEQLEGDPTKAVLASLPQILQLDIAEEIRGPILLSHSFLSDVQEENPRIVRHLCHEAIEEVVMQPSEVVFSAGDVCRRMLFVMSGTVGYTLTRRPSSPRLKRRPPTSFRPCPMPVGFNSMRVVAEQTNSQETYLRESDDMNLEADAGVVELSQTTNESSKAKRMRSRSPSDGNGSNILLNPGDFVSEAVLWTSWEYCGELSAISGATLLALDSASFAKVIARNTNTYSYAVRYARIFVKRLNNHGECSDVLRFHLVKSAVESEPFEYRTLDDPTGLRSPSKSMASLKRSLRRLEPISADVNAHFMFISHHKADAGTEAALMMEGLERMIHEDEHSSGHSMKAPVFLDSEDLSDLSQLKEHVRKSRNLVVLLTKEVLERPWVLVEIVTASKVGVHIVPVEVQKKDMSFDYPDEVFFSKILDGTGLTEDAGKMLLNEGITLEELEKALRKVFKKIAVPFSPHKSANVRDAELRDILRRCQDAVVDLS